MLSGAAPGSLGQRVTHCKQNSIKTINQMKYPKSRLANKRLSIDQEQEIAFMPRDQRKKLSREDKKYVQKIKNKYSAQRSRDERKLYITTLEEQILALKAENEMLRGKRCARCSAIEQTQKGTISQEQSQDFSSELDLPIKMESEEWERSEPSEFIGCGKFFIFLMAIFLVCYPDSHPTNNPPMQFIATQANPNPSKILFQPYKDGDVCLLKHYQQHWESLQHKDQLTGRQPAAFFNPEFEQYEGQKDLIFSDRPVIIKANDTNQDLAMSGQLEMWLNGKNLVTMRNLEGNWQAQRPMIDSTIRMQLSIKNIDWFSPLPC